MNPLQYTSEEMFSSTELIRKSKKVFDSLNKKDIEKAIILRDGKPAFMLLEFSEYEKIMKEYLHLKQKKELPVKEIKENVIEENETLEELNEKDLQEALDEIEKLNLEVIEEESKEKEQLKEFWE